MNDLIWVVVYFLCCVVAFTITAVIFRLFDFVMFFVDRCRRRRFEDDNL
jgi:hypothetical protein